MIIPPPKTVRIDVLIHWLKGIPRDTIALNIGIGRGSVSRIIQYFRKGEIPDIDSIRELCVYWKKNNLDITQIADSIRLSNLLKQLGLTEGQIENFVEQVNTHCFLSTDSRDFKDFILEFNRVSEMSQSLKVSIYTLVEFIEDKRFEIQILDNILSEKHHKIKLKESEYNDMVNQIKEYRRTLLFSPDNS